MKRYLEISITADERSRELLLPPMAELGCHGFQETDTALVCYIDCSGWNEETHLSFVENVSALAGSIGSTLPPLLRTIVEENWNEEWEKSLRPIEIGERLVVVPSYSDESAAAHGRLAIRIVPKMSFGTGYHESTRLTLRLLERHLKPGSTVLDVGTGTGILAIAAIKLGAARAVGLDVDEWSIANATENVNANGLAGRIEITAAPLKHQVNGFADIITANLTLNAIVEYLGEFRRQLKPAGVLLLSGLLTANREQLDTSLEAHSLQAIEALTENEWIAVAARSIP